jgi:hypothetical protein
MLLANGPDAGVFSVELDRNHVGAAADGAVLDVLLQFSGRGIERNHDLFAARITNVTAVRGNSRAGAFLSRRTFHKNFPGDKGLNRHIGMASNPSAEVNVSVMFKEFGCRSNAG